MTKRIAITTPTGNVGRRIVSELLEHRDVELVLLARRPEAWTGTRMEVRVGSLDDPSFVVDATRGVDALYWATPNSFAPGITMREGYRRFARSAADAIRQNAIRQVVHLSGFAHVDDGGGERSLFGALAETEATLADAARGSSITHLRAGFFFENLLGQLNYLRTEGRVFLPVDRKRRIPMVASRDVALRATELLLADLPSRRTFTGAFGPEDLSFSDVGAKLSEGLGRRISVVRLPQVLIRTRMLRAGRDERATDAFLLLFRAITKGLVTANPGRDDASTTPTSLSRWAREELAPLVDSDAAMMCPARVQYEVV